MTTELVQFSRVDKSTRHIWVDLFTPSGLFYFTLRTGPFQFCGLSGFLCSLNKFLYLRHRCLDKTERLLKVM